MHARKISLHHPILFALYTWLALHITLHAIYTYKYVRTPLSQACALPHCMQYLHRGRMPTTTKIWLS